VRVERVGDVVHCYGHGGAGVTLSWGCAGEVVELLG
jgi:D-amino-acid oxidase